ncbi:DUF2238 domain-containing protein [Paenibacillus sp. LMG 31456]|uniref:DUF2238 domain-containing protein n=1 Tax=Paenibacillus foliorum TaxID=2654974 RepID=A0A972JZ20_9BACL|nr:DUF2238 domain-containing protein [Paenibacillus foliorum]NOU92290.1 DUF2238 domain-containing protein [Paenibacillus foliorum]
MILLTLFTIGCGHLTKIFIKTNIKFSHNPLLQLILVVFLAFWGILAISPTDRTQWLLENILLVLVILVLCITYRKYKLSNLSYLLIFVFLCLHTYAAHYTYQGTPIDQWLKSVIHTRRSYFDRFVHMMFGLLWFYPIRELLTRITGLRMFWSLITTISFILSLGAVFEIIEMLVAILAGQTGQDYMGLQGDVFDSEKDMALSLIGAIISSFILAIIFRKRKYHSLHLAKGMAKQKLNPNTNK